MMPGSPLTHRKPSETPEWVFRWRGQPSPWIPKLIALAFTSTAFLLLVTTVRIDVRVPEKKSAPRKASVIYLGDDAESRALTVRADEGGPFPSRFEPHEWQGLADLERSVMDSTRFQPAAYVPVIADLPSETLVRPIEMAAKGQRFFPKRTPSAPLSTDAVAPVLAPILYPLAGVTAEALPRELPRFDDAAGVAASSTPWRFMIRLNPDGSVGECVSLEKGNEPGADALEAWLHQIQFAPPNPKRPRWIAVAIGFANPPADGAVPH